jgi:hypothetical protein
MPTLPDTYPSLLPRRWRPIRVPSILILMRECPTGSVFAGGCIYSPAHTFSHSFSPLFISSPPAPGGFGGLDEGFPAVPRRRHPLGMTTLCGAPTTILFMSCFPCSSPLFPDPTHPSPLYSLFVPSFPGNRRLCVPIGPQVPSPPTAATHPTVAPPFSRQSGGRSRPLFVAT